MRVGDYINDLNSAEIQFGFVLFQPKLIVSANCGMEIKKVIDYKMLLDQAIEMSAWKPQACIIYNRKHERVGRIYNVSV